MRSETVVLPASICAAIPMFLNFEMFKLIILSDFQLFTNANQVFDLGCKGREIFNTENVSLFEIIARFEL
jgi:hypothetical protein